MSRSKIAGYTENRDRVELTDGHGGERGISAWTWPTQGLPCVTDFHPHVRQTGIQPAALASELLF